MGKQEFVYLDSCVILDCISFKQGFTKVCRNRKFDIGEIDSQKAEIMLSEINIIEVTEHLKDAEATRIAIQEGYSYFDLNKQRLEEIELSEDNIKNVDELLRNELFNLPAVVSIKSKGLSKNDITTLLNICNKYSIFFVDAMHFLIADKEGCNYFITSDEKLRKGLNKLIEDSFSSATMLIMSPQEFKNSVLPKLVA
ncbi:MAG: hypothetical protein UR96_C0010G0012 [candidate division WS6 bacterium GW2011_GWC1_36_11]|uniref:Uncharacterized protein n=2 Tax=Candidatus Dojkabacteria TaxID=74243 RepID=A0A0G0DE32_9BACT|nr:MAG: hypothetical protein UR96_C0010G0012 [candidate division WS6 bacterium GW2011_GWC1_36_11]KKQ04667.1 MAG: hypothetical protein US14_C0003G0030 [candidate division WS6 bacterium GW2011_WS6_36_26]KKQ16968.1 MAG: hypothetical protein US29_C0015G0012 [candidate division WS6 bacterium GW2011_GWF1_36_8]HAM96295.1 hypothetical protein [Patescibacteria group bacterium]